MGSIRLLIDGYNLMFESTAVDRKLDGQGALRAARGRMLHLVLDLIDASMRDKTMIVFDAKKAPPGLPDKYGYHGIQIVFARDWNSADELIQAEIRGHSAPKNLTVVSSDHAIHRKSLARGAKVLDSNVWLDQQLDARARSTQFSHPSAEESAALELKTKNQRLSDEEMNAWLTEFGCTD